MKALSVAWLFVCSCGMVAPGCAFLEQCRVVICRCGRDMELICVTATVEIEDTDL